MKPDIKKEMEGSERASVSPLEAQTMPGKICIGPYDPNKLGGDPILQNLAKSQAQAKALSQGGNLDPEAAGILFPAIYGGGDVFIHLHPNRQVSVTCRSRSLGQPQLLQV